VLESAGTRDAKAHKESRTGILLYAFLRDFAALVPGGYECEVRVQGIARKLVLPLLSKLDQILRRDEVKYL
jgi:hypothetical protein